MSVPSRNTVKVKFSSTVTEKNQAIEHQLTRNQNSQTNLKKVTSLPTIHPSLSSDSLTSKPSEAMPNIEALSIQSMSNLNQHTLPRPPLDKQLLDLQKLLLQFVLSFNKSTSSNSCKSENNNNTMIMYVIPSQWFDDWNKRARKILHQNQSKKLANQQNSQLDTLNSIPTHLILQETSQTINKHVLIEQLQYGEDYYLLPPDIWGALQRWYGSGPSIPRFLNNSMMKSNWFLPFPIKFIKGLYGENISPESLKVLSPHMMTSNDLEPVIATALKLDLYPDPQSIPTIEDIDEYHHQDIEQVYVSPAKDVVKVISNINMKQLIEQTEDIQISEESKTQTNSNNTDNSSVLPPLPPSNRVTISSLTANSSETKQETTIAIPENICGKCLVCDQLCKSKCNRCKIAFYCSPNCQKLHWNYHKLYCGKITPLQSQLAEKENPIYKYRGVKGLQNLGNSCYMNASLQCLSHLKPLTKFFITNEYLNELNTENRDGTKGELAKRYAELLQDLWLNLSPTSLPPSSGRLGKIFSMGNLTSNMVYSPRKLKLALGQVNEEYLTNQQQDAHEVIELILDKLHEDVNRITKKPYVEKVEGDGTNDLTISREIWQQSKLREDSYIKDILGSLMRSQITCCDCSKCSISFDYHTTLQIAIPTQDTITLSIHCLPQIPRDILGHPNKLFPSPENNNTSSEWSVQDIRPFVLKLTIDKLMTIKELKHKIREELLQMEKKFFMKDTVIVLFKSFVLPLKENLEVPKTMTLIPENLLVKDILEAASGFLGTNPNNTPKKPVVYAYFLHPNETSNHQTTSKYCFIHPRRLISHKTKIVPVYTLYPILIRGEADWSIKRLKYQIWLYVTLYYLMDLSTSRLYPKVSSILHALQTNQIVELMNFSKHDLTYRCISMAGKPMFPTHVRDEVKDMVDASDRLLGLSLQYSVLDQLTFDKLIEYNVDISHFAVDLNSVQYPIILHEDNREDEIHPMDYWHLFAHETLRGLLTGQTTSRSRTNSHNIPNSLSSPNKASVHKKMLQKVQREAKRNQEKTTNKKKKIVKKKSKSTNEEDDEFDEHNPEDDNDPLHEINIQDDENDDDEENGLTLEECLTHFTTEERLEEGNEWYCNICKEHKRAFKYFSFCLDYLPKVLVFTLKRFEFRNMDGMMSMRGFSGRGGGHYREKINTFIDFPLQGLDMAKYCYINQKKASSATSPHNHTSSTSTENKNTFPTSISTTSTSCYDLVAVVNHYGRMGFGHYTSFARNWNHTTDELESQWYHYDDESVTPVQEEEVVSSSAYILFYRRRG